MCSIAQVLVDPYYRTLQGLQALIEKDWLSFGHKFTDRCGYLQSDAKETAPVFTQLVDAIWYVSCLRLQQHRQRTRKEKLIFVVVVLRRQLQKAHPSVRFLLNPT